MGSEMDPVKKCPKDGRYVHQGQTCVAGNVDIVRHCEHYRINVMIKTEQESNVIKGKIMVGHATKDEIRKFLMYASGMEVLLDENCHDCFGDDGWRAEIGKSE